MTIYKVRKDNLEFYVQQEMIEAYASMGYLVIKLDEHILTNEEIKSEVAPSNKTFRNAGEKDE